MLQANEYATHVSELQATIHQLSQTEQALRTSNQTVSKEKLTFERSATLQLGDMDAKIHSLRSELEAQTAAANQARYEAALAARETERLTQAARSYETQQSQVVSGMEEKYWQVKKELERMEQELEQTRQRNDRLTKDLEERDGLLESRDTELHIHARTKASQAALVDSLQRELAETQQDRTTLKAIVDTVPQLKGELASLQEARAELRTAQSRIVQLESDLQLQTTALDAQRSEHSSTSTLARQLETSLAEVRGRYQALVAPEGELETTKAKGRELEEELRLARREEEKLREELRRSKDAKELLDGKVEALVQYCAVKVNECARRFEEGVSAANAGGAAGTTALAEKDEALASSADVELPTGLRLDPLRASLSSLRSSLRSVWNEFHRLRSQEEHAEHRWKKLQQDNEAQRRHIESLENLANEQENEAAKLQEEVERVRRDRDAQLDGAEQALERLAQELGHQRSENQSLNHQNTTLLAELDERTTAVRLWAGEMEALARVVAPAENSGFGGEETQLQSQSPPLLLDLDRSSLGGSAPSSLIQHWPSVRATFGEVMFLLSGRVRGAVVELQDGEKTRSQQRAELGRLADELATLTQHLQHTTDAARAQAHEQTLALKESEALRLQECQRLTEESNGRISELQTGYEKIVKEVQEQNRTNTAEIISLTRQRHNLLTAVRLLYKALRPIWSRVQDLILQKSIQSRLLRKAEKDQKEVRALMLAMTGATAAPWGVRQLTPRGIVPRALFRSGVIAVLAARRLLMSPRRSYQVYGTQIEVRGEHLPLSAESPAVQRSKPSRRRRLLSERFRAKCDRALRTL